MPSSFVGPPPVLKEEATFALRQIKNVSHSPGPFSEVGSRKEEVPWSRRRFEDSEEKEAKAQCHPEPRMSSSTPL